MDEGQRKQEYRVLNDRHGEFVNVLILVETGVNGR